MKIVVVIKFLLFAGFFKFSNEFFNCVFYGADSSKGVTLNLNLCLFFCLSLPLLASLCKCVLNRGLYLLSQWSGSDTKTQLLFKFLHLDFFFYSNASIYIKFLLLVGFFLTFSITAQTPKLHMPTAWHPYSFSPIITFSYIKYLFEPKWFHGSGLWIVWLFSEYCIKILISEGHKEFLLFKISATVCLHVVIFNIWVSALIDFQTNPKPMVCSLCPADVL